MPFLKTLAASVPLAAISLVEFGERIVLIGAVLTTLTLFWRRVLRPIVDAAQKVVAGYHLLTEHVPKLLTRVQSIEEKFEALERVGEIVDLARDEHARAARDALMRVRSTDQPQ